MTPKKLLDSAVTHHKKMQVTNKLCAELHRKAAAAEEFEGGYRLAAIHKELGNVHEEMSRAHSQHVTDLGSAAAAAPDHWNLASQTLDSDGQPTNDKVRKSAAVVDDFLSKYRLTRQTPPTPNYRDVLS